MSQDIYQSIGCSISSVQLSLHKVRSGAVVDINIKSIILLILYFSSTGRQLTQLMSQEVKENERYEDQLKFQ